MNRKKHYRDEHGNDGPVIGLFHVEDRDKLLAHEGTILDTDFQVPEVVKSGSTASEPTLSIRKDFHITRSMISHN
jgi:hypothetical protein